MYRAGFESGTVKSGRVPHLQWRLAQGEQREQKGVRNRFSEYAVFGSLKGFSVIPFVTHKQSSRHSPNDDGCKTQPIDFRHSESDGY